MRFLVTGAAGFIGFHMSLRLLKEGHEVVGLDNINDYYDPKLKTDRLAMLEPFSHFTFRQCDLADKEGVEKIFQEAPIQRVIHLGAQAGVRHSLNKPFDYASSNLVGTLVILECCRHFKVEHLVYASSSSVYGTNTKIPFSTTDSVDHPASLYAATKKSNELMAHSYSHLYNIPTTGLRFFTVYGPWGRPDMAPMLFASAISEGRPIKVFNHGKMRRDFTYIDDIIESIFRIQSIIPQANPNWSGEADESAAPYKVYNIGNNQPVELESFIQHMETALGMKAEKEYLPMQPGDVVETFADIDALSAATGFSPSTPIDQGIERFIEWYRDYYSA